MVVGGKKRPRSLGQIGMRTGFGILALAALAACNPVVPDSGAGVGFQDYNSYLREREFGAAPVAAAPVTGFDPGAAAAALDRADGVTAAPLPNSPIFPPAGNVIGGTVGERPRGNAPVGIKVETGEMDSLVPGSAPGGVSDENDFAAVSARETIASDKARIDTNRAQYTVIQPGALPVRPGASGPNIVEYALATNNAPGVALYSRSKLRIGGGAGNCGQYGSPDVAQEAFLANGGPDRDRRGLDPDGDGFACDWDPRPFRTALQ